MPSNHKSSPKRHIDCILINPPDDFSRYPYLGLCYLAAVLRQKGILVEILDAAAMGFSIKEASEYILSKKPKIIGISVMSMRLPFCYRLIQILQDQYPEGIIVVGGAHINADTQIIKDLNIRYGFHGDCEFEFADFCESILNCDHPQIQTGLIENDNNHIVVKAPAYIEDLDVLPMPAYDLLPLEKYYSPLTNQKTISMITSRGCPYNCIFCSKLQQTRYRYLSTERLLNQIEILVTQHGIQWIEFVDEIFTVNRKRIKDLCQAILESKLRFNWGCGTRADRVDDDLLVSMRAAGCQKISFGVETGSKRIRYLDNKNISNEQYIEAINLCRKHAIKTSACYIFGHPTETVKDMKQTLKFAFKLKTDFVIFTKMIPIPNSELFEVAKKEGSVPANIWTLFMRGEKPYPIYYPEDINSQTMDRLYIFAWLRYYLSFRNIISKLPILLTPSFFFKSLKAFYALVSGKKYKTKDL